MRRIPLLPLFAACVAVAMGAIALVFATNSRWAVAAAFAVLLAMLAVVGSEILLYINDRLE